MLEQLQNVFRKVFDNANLLISAETSAKDILLWDSLTHIDLIDSIEREFRIRFTFDEVMRFNNVNDMLKVIERKLKEKKQRR